MERPHKPVFKVRFGIVVHGSVFVAANDGADALQTVKKMWSEGKLNIDMLHDDEQPEDAEDLILGEAEKLPNELQQDIKEATND